LWAACQPIVIGAPEADAGSQSGGSSPGSGGSILPQQGGMAGEDVDEPIAGASPVEPCTEGSLVLQGHVRSERGAPVIGARVELKTEPPRFTLTDHEGHYAFDELCPGSYRVTPVCTAHFEQVKLVRDTVQDFSGKPDGCDSSPVEPRVLLVIYDPTMTGAGEAPKRLSTTLQVEPPDVLAQQSFDELSAATNGHVRVETASVISSLDFPPLQGGSSYGAAEYSSCLSNESACLAAEADFVAISSQLDLCTAAQQGRADQIWLLGGDHFGFPALQQLECQPRAETQEPLRTVDVLGLSYAAGLTGLMAQYRGYADRALVEVFGSATGQSNRYAPYHEALTTRALPGCEALVDDDLGFSRSWFSELPRDRWLDDQGRYNDFWRYLVRPQDRLPREEISVACSSSWLPGWCEYVRDDVHGECNSSEWATLGQTSGWVEFSFEPERIISGLQLYDRACDEQVLSGHIELSDGSADIPFGELEQSGKEFTSINFDPKTLSGLRVVIDSGTGGNPGFGEITLMAKP
jgi:hypothetical protein